LRQFDEAIIGEFGIVVKPWWGAKRLCQSCGAKFYDMGRNPIRCPKCDTVFEPDSQSKPKRSRVVAQAEKPKSKAKKPTVVAEQPAEDPADGKEPDIDVEENELVETEGLDAEESDEDEDVIEDVSELGEDEDDVAEVLNGMVEDDSEDR
jgi:uncharacterized protein (TIGR02300 family)